MPQKPDPNSRRAALREASRREELRKRRRRLIIWGSSALAVVDLVVAVALWATRPGSPATTATGAASYPNEARGHITGTATYDTKPPVGGNHASVWQNCGIYTEPVVDENAVHSLEHGAMWITYRPDLAADQVKTLQDLLRNQPYALLSPYPDLPAPVVASAWGVQMKLTSASDPQLSAFITEYGDGSKAPEPKGSAPEAWVNPRTDPVRLVTTGSGPARRRGGRVRDGGTAWSGAPEGW